MKRLLLYLSGGIIVVGSVFAFGATRVYGLDEYQCLSCHGNPQLTKTNADGKVISLYVSQADIDASAHRYIDCTTCHGSDPHKVDSPLNKQSLAQKCGSCHQYEYQQHAASVHGQQLAQGNQDVATCVDCHSPTGNPHSVIRVLEYDAPAYKKNIAQTCAKCHNDSKLMASYGIVENVYESYMRTFHGKAIQLSSPELSKLSEATCTNCHGVHDIKAVNDPSSPVAGLANLAKTCEQCHPGAGVNFASGFLGHKEASADNIPVAHDAEVVFKILLISVISFGAVIVILAILRFSASKWKVEHGS